MNPTFQFAEGEVLLIDKPYRWTSFDVVKRIRGLAKTPKVGHAGTLDPLATGLLIVCTGKKTKTIDQLVGMTKEYTGTLVLGKTTPSIDLETAFDSQTSIENINHEAIEAQIPLFIGDLLQVPPIYSAVQVDGQRAYKAARKGKELELKPRPVHIFSLTFDIVLPEVRFKMVCSKGTYIRSFVRDLGQNLGVGAYLSELRRTKIGDFSIEEAWNLAQLTEILQKKNLEEKTKV